MINLPNHDWSNLRFNKNLVRQINDSPNDILYRRTFLQNSQFVESKNVIFEFTICQITKKFEAFLYLT